MWLQKENVDIKRFLKGELQKLFSKSYNFAYRSPGCDVFSVIIGSEGSTDP